MSLFRRKSKRDRVLAAGRRVLPSRRTVAATAWVVGGAAALTAVSSTLSAVRQKKD